MEEEKKHRTSIQAAGFDREEAEEAVRRLDAVRHKIGRLAGPSVVEDLRRDRSRDER